MKVLDFIAAIFVPGKMSRFKNMIVIIPLFILLLGSYIIALPYSVSLSKKRYEILDSAPNYHLDIFNYVVDKDDENNLFTEEELLKYNDENKQLIYESDLKSFTFKTLAGNYIPNENETFEIGKEYILKSIVPKKDEEGIIIENHNYYIHLVFDIFDPNNNEEVSFDIPEKFDKLPSDEDGEFRHFLVVFYSDGFAYRSAYDVENHLRSFFMEYKKVNIDFSELNDATYISHKIADMLVPVVKLNYTFYSFIYVILIPLVVSLLLWLILRKGNSLITFKNYFNIAGLVAIPLIIIFFSISWIPIFLRKGIMEYFPVAFLIYYIICVGYINKRSSIE